MKRTNLFLVCLIIFISAQSSSIAINPITPIVALFLTAFIFLSRGLKIDKSFVLFTFVYFLLSSSYYFVHPYVDTLYIFYYYALLLYAYFTIKILGNDFFEITHSVLYVLSLISLPLFFLQLLNFDLMFQFVGVFQNLFSFLEYNNDVFSNNLFFTIDKTGAIYRNSGFAWEPKGFANFLIIGILINSILYNFKINKKIIVFIIALMTTFSTAGYIMLIIAISGFIIANKKIKINYLIPFAILSFGIFISSSDFIFKKIYNEIYNVESQIDKVYDKRYFKARSLGRFGSLIIDFNDFKKYPITGYGIQRRDTSKYQLRTQSKYNYTKLVRVNGFSDRLASFGILGMGLYILSLYAGFKRYLNVSNLNGQTWVVILFLMMEFATNLLTSPFWMIFLFLYFMDHKKKILKI